MTEQEMAVKLTEVEARSKSNTHRLEKVEKQQADLGQLITTVEVLATKEASVEADVKEIKADVKSITQKPGKRWENIVDKVLWLLVGAAIAALFAQAGVAL